ncbi:hypothetical protein [Paracidovorax oryzae]|uniref:hypothetical protein n=1 Tax=Paracidovorax oryzae TaxID=862720 RepID=UPI0012FEF6CF|nr:hypothetical protein [Paracidovorax oryzae]
MTNYAAVPLPGWLNPMANDSTSVHPLVIYKDQIAKASRRVLGEPLTAQRIITASHFGLALADDNEQSGMNLSGWGHSLPSAVAVLMPPPASITESAMKRARRKLQEQLLTKQLSWPDLASVRDSAFLLCADHKPPEYGLPNQLYLQHKPDGLLPWAGVHELLDQLMGVVSPVVAPTWIGARSALREALATIFSETFKNTHDHARENIDGSNLDPSVRAIYARYYPMQAVLKDIAQSPTDGITQAERYIRSFTPTVAKPGVRAPEIPSVNGFLELSVLDSGPGMAAKWLRRPVHDLDPRQQLEAVLQCFGKGRTTTTSPGRGFGLWKVLISLAGLRGFISIRTNSIHAFRQFGLTAATGQEELAGGQRVPKEQLYDWKRGLSTTPSDYPHVQGTVISFLIPMGQE